jgi:REP element-mobilizing transposase RayT
MANYRRNFLPGGSYFFTVNLADRRQVLLTEHIASCGRRFAGCGHGIPSRSKLP